jgi:phage gp29-like protein
MNPFAWLRQRLALSPSKLTAGEPVAGSKPLHEQFQRIGGSLTPADVTMILRAADAGQPARLVDLTNESRQKDGHFQGIANTRDISISLLDIDFILPPDATPKEEEAAELCRSIVANFRNWPTLVQHLSSSWLPGHATSELRWEKNKSLLTPVEAMPIHARRFIFSRDTGELRFARTEGDQVGTDILADNPGRIVQIQRRIVGDVPAREGAARVLLWAALFRNWGLRDWIALGEVGWKPWRRAAYKPGAHQADIDALVRMMEQMGLSGVGAFPDNANLTIEWPKAMGTGGSTHLEFQAHMGREMSKVVLGQTTSTEPGANGSRASDQVRDGMRLDIREAEARDVAAALRWHLFIPAIAVNIGGDLRCPVPWFQTDESIDRKEFSEAVMNLRKAGVRIPAKWVRDEVGMPEPVEGDELLGDVGDKPEEGDDPEGDDPEGNEPDDEAEPKKGRHSHHRRLERAEGAPKSARDGLEYVDRVNRSLKSEAAAELAPFVGTLLALMEQHTNFRDLRHALAQTYRDQMPPEQLAELIGHAGTMARLSGHYAVNEE